MRHQLHLMPSTREWFIERHDFFVSQIKARVLANFGDVSGEAERAAQAEYERLMHLPAREDIELSDLAEVAEHHAQELYLLLDDMREQSLLGALAGCFHQWDKELRTFLDNELMHTMPKDTRVKIVWNPDWNVLFNCLAEFGWDVRTSSVFPYLDAARLIVNVYKHGNGPSLTTLAKKYPMYVHDPLPEMRGSLPSNEFLDHAWVTISEEEFEELATRGIRQFWIDFPELMLAPP